MRHPRFSQREEIRNVENLNAHRTVETGRREQTAIGTECNAGNSIPVSVQGDQFLTSAGVPYFGAAIPTGSGDAPAIRAERDAERVHLVTVQGQ